ncbi:MAG: ATP-dependent Clp protease proteolytic subunit [Puniceicoccales bacterium]|jgi:ATP-dependent Clp protease protease subunit|nr:ATP-dependent Clp protease proteolytic subunit [Puniceicoccales bacterium]
MSYLPLPYVYERDGRQERSWDIYSRLLKDRIIFIGSAIDDFVANAIVAQLLFLQMEDAHKDISIYINSSGGSITDGMAIYDTMKFMSCDIATYCVGQAASMAAILLAAGTKGKRYALLHSRMMIHQPYGEAGGQASDISIVAKEIGRCRESVNEILSTSTGQDIEKIKKDSDRNFFMTADEAKAYGIIDEVVVQNPHLSTGEKS